jgi:hypothetical protein
MQMQKDEEKNIPLECTMGLGSGKKKELPEGTNKLRIQGICRKSLVRTLPGPHS